MPSLLRLKYAQGCFEYVALIHANEFAVAPAPGFDRSRSVTAAPRRAKRYARLAPMMPPPAITTFRISPVGALRAPRACRAADCGFWIGATKRPASSWSSVRRSGECVTMRGILRPPSRCSKRSVLLGGARVDEKRDAAADGRSRAVFGRGSDCLAERSVDGDLRRE